MFLSWIIMKIIKHLNLDKNLGSVLFFDKKIGGALI